MRLFFALWPDAHAGALLAGLAREMADLSQGKAVPADKIHLTLAFLGEVPDGRVREAAAAAAGVRSGAFDLALDTLGWFRGARVGWIGASQPVPELLALQSSLDTGLKERSFAGEDRAYAPHVTLARKVHRPVQRRRVEPVRWRALELTLVLSETATGRYCTIGRWKLGT